MILVIKQLIITYGTPKNAVVIEISRIITFSRNIFQRNYIHSGTTSLTWELHY